MSESIFCQPQGDAETLYANNSEWLLTVIGKIKNKNRVVCENLPRRRLLGFYDQDEQRHHLYNPGQGWFELKPEILSFFDVSNEQMLIQLGMGILKIPDFWKPEDISKIWDFSSSKEGEEFVHLNDEVEPAATPKEVRHATLVYEAHKLIKAGVDRKYLSKEILGVYDEVWNKMTHDSTARAGVFKDHLLKTKVKKVMDVMDVEINVPLDRAYVPAVSGSFVLDRHGEARPSPEVKSFQVDEYGNLKKPRC